MTPRHGHLLATPRFTEWAGEAARALDQQQWLRVYETGFVWPEGAVGTMLAAAAERVIGGAARKAIALRKRPPIRGDVRVSLTIDLFRTAAALARWPRLEDRLWEWDEHRFAENVAARLPTDLMAVHAYEHSALEILERARAHNIIGILHTASLHPRASEELTRVAMSVEPALRATVAFELHERRGPRDRRREREYELATIITAPSRFAARALIDHGVDAAKVKVIPFGGPEMPIDARHHPRRTGPVRVLYAGRIGAHKGCHHLAAAWRQLKTDAALVYVGPLGLPRELLEGPRVRILPPLERASLFDEMRRSDVLVLPTLGDTFGLVVVEALAHGIPVVVTDCAGVADLVREGVNGWVVKAGDAGALAARLAWITEHPDVVRNMRRAILASGPARTWTMFRSELVAAMRESRCAA